MRALLTFNEAHEINQEGFPVRRLEAWLEEILSDLRRHPDERPPIRWPQVFRSRWSGKPFDLRGEVSLTGSHFREIEIVIPEPALLDPETGRAIAAWLREKATEIEAYGRGDRPHGAEWGQDMTFSWSRPLTPVAE